MNLKYDYWEPKLELTNLYETNILVEYLFYRNDINFHNSKIVDICCGWGENTRKIACGMPKDGFYQIPLNVTGLDYDKDEIDKANASTMHLNNIDFEYHDVTKKFPFENDSIDIFISTYALHNLEDHHKLFIFKEIERSLKSNGSFIYIDVIFNNSDDCSLISQKDSLEKLWRKEAFALAEKELNVLLDVHLDPSHPFSLLLTGEKEFPITSNQCIEIGKKANFEIIDARPVKGLVSCQRIIFRKSANDRS